LFAGNHHDGTTLEETVEQIRLQSVAQGRTVNIEIATLRQVLKASDLWLPLAGKVWMLRERHDVAKTQSRSHHWKAPRSGY
jgi:hypothetical protein